MKQKTKLRLAKGVVLLSVVPLLIHAYEYGPDAGVAGVPGEAGNCSQSGCHTGTAVNGGGGNVTVTFPNGLTYTPGSTQHLVVTITDSKQRRWGFELTARTSSNTTQMAGAFSPTDNRTQLICASSDLRRQLNFTTACPANMPLDYIEQTLAGYSASQANPGKFEFDWTAPATDVGPVTIYVAANAANGDVSQNGDHIYTATYTLTAVASAPLPAITSGGVTNAASQAAPGAPNSAIAQGSIFVINGANLGPATAAQASGYPLQTALAGTSVQVTVNGTALAAPIVAASATQVTAIMPSATPVGSGTVTVTSNNQTSATELVQVAAASFGIYTLNGSGSGPAQVTDPNGAAITLTSPAQPGEIVTVAGTGLGALSADDVSQPAQQDISSQVTLYVGTEQAALQYAGRSGAAPGQDQVTFTIPSDAITGCYVPLAVVVNNITSNFASVAISPDGSPCSDPSGLTQSQTQLIQAAGRSVQMGSINLTRMVTGANAVDTASGAFGAYTPTQLASWLGPSPAASTGGCLAFGSSLNTAPPQAVDAGTISISGPNGSQQLTGSAGVYSGQFASYLDPGSYTISGSGAGGFNAQVNVPPPIVWTNPASAVQRSQGLTVTWTGGDPAGFVYISGTSGSATFTCTSVAGAGSFTVPPFVTQALPSSSSGTLTLTGISAPVPFTAPSLDVGLATGGSGVSQTVAVQ